MKNLTIEDKEQEKRKMEESFKSMEIIEIEDNMISEILKR